MKTGQYELRCNFKKGVGSFNYNLRMTDLSNLFHTPSRLTTLSNPRTMAPARHSRAPERPVISAFSVTTHPAPSTQPWSLGQLEQSLRRGVKMQLSEDELRQEINMFTRREREQLLRKGLVIGGMLLIIYLLTNWHIFFVSAMLMASQLACTQALPLSQEAPIRRGMTLIRPFLEAILLYCLLKFYFNQPYTSINWPLTLLALTATIALQIIHIYTPLTDLTCAKHIVRAVRSKSVLRKVLSLPPYLYRKMVGLLSVKNHLAIVSCLAIVLFIFNFGFANTVSGTLRPDYILATILVTFCLQLCLQTASYIDKVVFDPLKIIHDKMPIFLSLLRLKPTHYHRSIQRQCIKSLFIRTVEIECFLSSQTCKSLVYRSYMDLFNQYAMEQLEAVNASFLNLLKVIRNNKMILQSSKTLLDDLFIHFRKGQARLENEWNCLSIVQELTQTAFILAVIVAAEKEAREHSDGVRVSPRVQEIIVSIKDKLLECAEMKFLSTTMRNSLLQGHLWLQKDFWEVSDASA